MSLEGINSIFRVRLLPYGVATLSVALALGLTRSLLPWIYPTTTPLFFIAVIVSTWYGSLGAGLLATILSTLAINYFFIEPFYSLQIANVETIVRLGMFSIVAGLIASLNLSWRTAIKNAKAALQNLQEAMELEQQVQGEAAQAATTEAKEQLETVLSSINDGFYILDRDWRYTYANDRYCEMVGMPRSAILGQNVWELFPAAVDTDAYVQFHRAMREQTSLQFDYLYSPWNGWHDHRIYPSSSGLTVLLADITDRKQAELILIEQKRLLESLAFGQPLDDCLAAVCVSVSRLNPSTRACFLLADDRRLTFNASITPDFPPSFGEGLKDAPINDLCMGTCGEAVYCGQPVTCADIANDDGWSQAWRNLCVAHGILGCHSQPVIGQDNVALGSLMLCFSEARRPTDWEYKLAEFGTQVASIAFERDRSFQALRESEEQLRLACEGGNFGLWYLDIETDALSFTDRAKAMFGLPVNTAMSLQVFLEAVHPDDRPFVHTVISELKANQAHTEIEYRTLWADGTVRWILAKGDCAYNAEGILISTRGVLIDISDRKQAEEALRQSEEQSRNILESIDDGFFSLDENWRFTYMNRSAEILLDRTSGDLMGKNLWEEFPGLEGSEFERVHRRVANERVALSVTAFYRDHDRWYDVRTYPAANGITIYFRNVTDRKLGEEVLQQREAELRLVTNAVPALISFVDSDQRYRFHNRAYEEWFGLQAKEIYGKHLPEVLGETGYQAVLPYVEQVLAGEEVTFESQIPYKNGVTRYVNATYVPRFNSQGKVEGFVALVNDITDRKQAEATLRESEARFRLMADAAPVLIWMSDTDKLCYYFNLPWLNFTGRTIEQERGNGWAQGVHPHDLDRCLGTYVTAFDARQPFKMEYRLKRFDGIYRWVMDEAVPRYGLEGEFLGYIGSCVDIEDHKQAEEALRQSESRLRLIFESAKDYAIFTLDLNGIIASWNSGAERLLGYTETEAIGCSIRMIFTPEDNEQGQAECERQTALLQGRAEDERWHVRKDGNRFWASGLMMPLLNEADCPQGFVKIMQDKTAQRQASERLQLLYETTRDLLKTQQPLALMHTLFRKLSVQLDLHCYYNFMVEEKDNRLMLHLRNYDGLSEERAQAIAWIELGEYLCGLVAQTQQQLVLNQAQISTHPNAKAISEMGITAYAGQPLIAQGRLLGTLSFASRTRTHFTPAEIELLRSTCDQIAIALERASLNDSLQQQAEQLRQVNRIKDEFLAVLSHELRSPLNPILGWSKLLQTGKLDAAKTAQALATIERNARLQSELIEDLLDVSKILQGKLSLNMRPVDLALTVESAIETVNLASVAKSIDIRTVLDPQVGQILGDSGRLQQIVWNLVSNAVKFTSAGGRVEVNLTRVGNQAQITVADTGIGIAREFLPYVFDYFRQKDGATTRKFGGLGLGLAIVRHLVELHGGTVVADSPGEGLGATFTVRLPLSGKVKGQENSLAGLSERSTADEPLSGMRILVVDDEPDMRDLISFLLEDAGAEVVTVAVPQEALTALTNFQPDVLLSDIGMPGMDGYMLLRQVRSLPPERGGLIPAIALTAYAGEFNQQQALQAGFHRHLAKPIEPDQLIKTIAALLSKNTHDPASYKN
ncbi:PAS domain S-box protein [Microcoleus vaginatus PCC 9802]|uniref:PAS domain S-box protein n=1 Tax=Microcoleus vaginatus TaxID=119532 RepID=UPI00020D2798|nr:multi-sensor hybrid histidine kinase [Microcoleus vaginatus FGP-2]UNU19430.1 PAS domain S-box protein [Microcoleus vaginatus PCC 9802]